MIGARILVTAGNADKLARAKELGAHEGIAYRNQDFTAEVKKLTAKRGVEVVIDHVGQDTLPGSIKCLAKGGRLVTCGGTSGPELKTDVRLVFFKGLSILGSTMGSLGEMHTILKHFERGTFQPVVDRVLPGKSTVHTVFPSGSSSRTREGDDNVTSRFPFSRILMSEGSPGSAWAQTSSPAAS